jgi:hypothetical protein
MKREIKELKITAIEHPVKLLGSELSVAADLLPIVSRSSAAVHKPKTAEDVDSDQGSDQDEENDLEDLDSFYDGNDDEYDEGGSCFGGEDDDDFSPLTCSVATPTSTTTANDGPLASLNKVSVVSGPLHLSISLDFVDDTTSNNLSIICKAMDSFDSFYELLTKMAILVPKLSEEVSTGREIYNSISPDGFCWYVLWTNLYLLSI